MSRKSSSKRNVSTSRFGPKTDGDLVDYVTWRPTDHNHTFRQQRRLLDVVSHEQHRHTGSFTRRRTSPCS